MSQVVQYLPRKHEPMSSNPSVDKKQKKRQSKMKIFSVKDKVKISCRAVVKGNSPKGRG
jgi:hypothetical protein